MASFTTRGRIPTASLDVGAEPPSADAVSSTLRAGELAHAHHAGGFGIPLLSSALSASRGSRTPADSFSYADPAASQLERRAPLLRTARADRRLSRARDARMRRHCDGRRGIEVRAILPGISRGPTSFQNASCTRRRLLDRIPRARAQTLLCFWRAFGIASAASSPPQSRIRRIAPLVRRMPIVGDCLRVGHALSVGAMQRGLSANLLEADRDHDRSASRRRMSRAADLREKLNVLIPARALSPSREKEAPEFAWCVSPSSTSFERIWNS